MKKHIYYFIAFLFLNFFFLFPNSVHAEVGVVSINDKVYQNIEDAYQDLSSGDEIKLLQNIDLSTLGEEYLALLHLPDHVVFDLGGFDIKIGWNSKYCGGIGNLIFTGEHITIKNGSFSGRPSYTLWIGDEKTTNDFVVENVKVDGGINVYNATNVLFRNLEVKGHDYYSVWTDNASVILESGAYQTKGKYGLVGLSNGPLSSLSIAGGTFQVNDGKFLPNSNKPSISGGNFNIPVDEYLVSGYECIFNNNKYIVRKKVTVASTELLNAQQNSKVSFSQEYLPLIEKVMYDTLYNTSSIDILNRILQIKINVSDLVPDEVIEKAVANLLDRNLNGAKIISYFDISIHVFDKTTNLLLGNLTELTDKVKFTVDIPEAYQNAPKGYIRKFYIVREHNNHYEILDTDVASNHKTLTFATDLFSAYTLVYYDEEVLENPNTYDGDFLYFSMFCCSFLFIIAITLVIKRKKNS